MTSSFDFRVRNPGDSGRASRVLVLIAAAAVLLGVLGMHSIAFGTATAAAAASGHSHVESTPDAGSPDEPHDPCSPLVGESCCVVATGSTLTTVPFPAPSLPLVPPSSAVLPDASHLLMATEAPTHPPSYAELSVIRV